jgi:hypothetical protein
MHIYYRPDVTLVNQVRAAIAAHRAKLNLADRVRAARSVA